jgi:formiminotetrahydrofolate cyclodeaminase
LPVLDFSDYLDRLASAEPTPGGGSAATLVGAMSAALVSMVARITAGSPKHAALAPSAIALAAEGDALRAEFVAARPRDEAAYQAVVVAQALPRATDSEKIERTRRLQIALAGAAEAPLTVAALGARALALCERAAELHNAHLMSDVECALRFARAAIDASVANVQVNHRFLKNAETVSEQTGRLSAILDAAHAHEARALATITAAP